MLPKTGRRLPKTPPYSDLEIADAIGRALAEELGGTRRATKTVMRWANVSERGARAWINGESCPSCRHLILMASRSRAVMAVILRLSGHEEHLISLDLAEIEKGLLALVERLRALREIDNL
jgi:hypothetical protein